MATQSGNDGLVKIGTGTVAEIRSWAIAREAGTVESTVMGDTSKQFKALQRGWEASIEAYWNEEDAADAVTLFLLGEPDYVLGEAADLFGEEGELLPSGQAALTPGRRVWLHLYPGGAGTGDAEYSGDGVVAALDVKGSHDGMVEASIKVRGSAALSRREL
jgi:predicted secreted protein